MCVYVYAFMYMYLVCLVPEEGFGSVEYITDTMSHHVGSMLELYLRKNSQGP